MIATVTIGSGNRRRTVALPCHHARDVHRSLRQDAAESIKDYLFGPRDNNRSRNRAFKRGKLAQINA